jgi:phage terminase large subunit-like protein
MKVTAEDLRHLSKEEFADLMEQLGPKDAEELLYNWKFWARPDQLEPPGKYKIWMPLAGRGWGKTRTGAETVREWVKQGLKRIACVAPTKGDVRRVMVEGNSGLLNICSKDDKTHRGADMGYPVWSPTNNTLSWANGAKAEFFSAEDPERLRGPQFHAAWCFTAGHYVDTPYGKINVEKLSPGYQVETSEGPRRITHTSKRNMPVGVVEFSDGTKLEGTYDHPIYTQRGWIPLGELKESDTCLKLNMTDTSGELMHRVTTIRQAKELFTDMLLRKSMATLPGMMYTTLMGTNSITLQVTCNSSPEQSTLNYTTANGVCQSANQKANESFLVTVVERLWLGSKSLAKGFIAKVANTVGLKKKEKRLEPVVTAEKVSGHGWELSALNVVSTWQLTGVKPVYNLRVENTHEYFCNGILTHNCDELAAWRNMQATWDMLQFTLRLGQNPKILITTTPKPVKLVRHIIALSKEQPDKYVVTTGSSYDNKDNIDLEALSQYEGTRLGRQELYAEVLEEAAGALWTVEMIDKCQAYPEDVDIEALQRIVVAVDPAVTANEESDMTGIVVAGIDVNGHGVVIEDATEQLSPSGWAKKVVDLYHKYGADRIVAERNQGGEMVRHTIETEDNTVPIRLVHASRGKFARAEPVSALYEQGRVKHLPGLDELEQQMVTWEPLGSMGSPDRLDALVWAMTDLMLGGILKPNLQLSYEPQKSSSGEMSISF